MKYLCRGQVALRSDGRPSILAKARLNAREFKKLELDVGARVLGQMGAQDAATVLTEKEKPPRIFWNGVGSSDIWGTSGLNAWISRGFKKSGTHSIVCMSPKSENGTVALRFVRTCNDKVVKPLSATRQSTRIFVCVLIFFYDLFCGIFEKMQNICDMSANTFSVFVFGVVVPSAPCFVCARMLGSRWSPW